ncbi:ovochymase-2-like isoform X1 [Stegastes partitus]|uniref:Ovochymase-2-like isoform X1 n=1 Tax=Stegastes partitus TaxID=144197 RepID=A0A9Y4NTV9_9TELE|nr:PREDICTED: ovochymase-2-like isoform X1 [Stegastes partitus]
MRHRAVRGHSDPGCGTVVLVEDPAAVHSPNYPQSYGDDCVLRWVVYAPHGHVVKLDFADFDLEESDRCLYDSLTVFGDVAGTEEIAVLCGRGPPPPVLSYHSVMVLQFTSDSSVAHGGFSASLTFISDADLHDRDGPDVEQHPDVFTANRRHTAPHERRNPATGFNRLQLTRTEPDKQSFLFCSSVGPSTLCCREPRRSPFVSRVLRPHRARFL